MRMITARLLLCLMAALVPLVLLPSTGSATKMKAAKSYFVYVGTYTGPNSRGIYAFRFDAATGQAASLGLVAETVSPSFLAIDPGRKFLYAVNEVSDYQGKKSGAISAFAIDGKSGKLTFLNQVPSEGAGPCYVALDKTGKYVLVANYDSGSVAVFPVLKDGKLGEPSSVVQHSGHGADPQRQEGPHAHEIELSSDNRFAIAADLGLDELLVYKFDPAKGTLTANDPPFGKLDLGSGPRHFGFHPSNRFLYVTNEMTSTATGFSYDPAKGALSKLNSVSTLPESFKGSNDTAELEVHPDGGFFYVSNRGHDSIALFAIDSVTGAHKFVETVSTGGKTPRNFAIDPSGDYLFAANQKSDNIVIFKIDRKTGHLTPTGQVLQAPSPVCVSFVAIE